MRLPARFTAFVFVCFLLATPAFARMRASSTHASLLGVVQYEVPLTDPWTTVMSLTDDSPANRSVRPLLIEEPNCHCVLWSTWCTTSLRCTPRYQCRIDWVELTFVCEEVIFCEIVQECRSECSQESCSSDE
jgi:hypothetical protein